VRHPLITDGPSAWSVYHGPVVHRQRHLTMNNKHTHHHLSSPIINHHGTGPAHYQPNFFPFTYIMVTYIMVDCCCIFDFSNGAHVSDACLFAPLSLDAALLFVFSLRPFLCRKIAVGLRLCFFWALLLFFHVKTRWIFPIIPKPLSVCCYAGCCVENYQ
jgi:hypothetical protein